MWTWIRHHWPWSPRQTLGGVLLALGIAIPILLAYLGSRSQPPSAAWQGFLAFAAAVFQIAAALVFTRIGVVDPSHPRGAMRRLELLRQRSAIARSVADRLADSPEMKLADRRALLGELGVWMSVFQDEVVQAMEDWSAAMPHALDLTADELQMLQEQTDGQ